MLAIRSDAPAAQPCEAGGDDGGSAVAGTAVLQSIAALRNDGARARPFGQELHERWVDERHVARQHDDRADGAEHVDSRDERGKRPGARWRFAHRAHLRNARPDLDHRVAHLGEHPRRTRRERLAAPLDRRLVGAHAPARSPGQEERGQAAHVVRMEYPTTSQPIGRFSSSTRFCTLPSGVVTRVATTAVWRVETTSSTTTSAPMCACVTGVRRTLASR